MTDMHIDYSDTLSVSRLELHMARGNDNIWHAWLYDPAADEIIATGVQQGNESLANLIARDVGIIENY